MTRLAALVLLLVTLVATGACVKQYYDSHARSGDGSSPTGPTPVGTTHTIEYRVIGAAAIQNATIDFGSDQQGTTEVFTVLPWSASFKTARSSVFVFLHVTTFWEGRVTAQIFVDGELFREATTDFSVNTTPLDVSGTITD